MQLLVDDVSRDRLWAWPAAAAATVFLGGALVMSHIERGFMDRLGWDVWPSGLALGPQGWGQNAVFLVFASCYLAFALRFFARATWSRPVRAVRWLLLLGAGCAPLLAFRTDPPGAPVSWHGVLHAAGYGGLMLSLLPTLLVVGVSLVRRSAPRDWAAAPAALLLLPLASLAPNGTARGGYLFFAVPLTVLAALASPLGSLGSSATVARWILSSPGRLSAVAGSAESAAHGP